MKTPKDNGESTKAKEVLTPTKRDSLPLNLKQDKVITKIENSKPIEEKIQADRCLMPPKASVVTNSFNKEMADQKISREVADSSKISDLSIKTPSEPRPVSKLHHRESEPMRHKDE